MNRAHRRFLELAAASIDFALSRAERDELGSHLATCSSCARAIDGMRADARSLRALPTRELALVSSQVILRRALRRGPDIGALRLVAVAAVLALLLVGLVVVGSELLRPPQTPVLPGPSDVAPASSVLAMAWRPAAPLQIGRSRHVAGVLADGRVMVAGGSNPSNLASSEIFDPTAGGWSLVAMLSARVGHAGGIMPDGEFLLVGGSNTADVTLASSEYNAVAVDSELDWLPGPNLVEARMSHAVAVWQGRTVLAIGGFDQEGRTLASVEVWPLDVLSAFLPDAPLTVARGLHTVVTLADGRVLIVGGVGLGGGPIASTELFDAETEQWHEVGAMLVPRVDHTTTMLPDGRVLVAGGFGGEGAIHATAEVFDPATETWTQVASMAEARGGHEAVLVDGRVLVVGGESAVDTLPTTEWFDPTSGQWSPGPTLLQARSYFELVQLRDGSVMAIGGQWTSASGLTDVEVLGPIPAG